CFGANAVHFSILQEYMAAHIGVPMGVYRQVSNNLHLYTAVVPVDQLGDLIYDVSINDRYHHSHSHVDPTPVIDCDPKLWDEDLREFFLNDGFGHSGVAWHSKFFQHTVMPMSRAHQHWRQKEYDEAMDEALNIASWE